MMATSNPPVGIDHLTTVPENFDPDGENAEGDKTTEESSQATGA